MKDIIENGRLKLLHKQYSQSNIVVEVPFSNFNIGKQ